MKEIKSVRVRKTNVKSGTLDIKVSLYENKRTFAADEMVLVGTNNGNIVWQEARYKIKNTTEPIFFISNFIATNNNLGSTDKNSYYDIIQDPWEETAPIIRNYGYDPYYLNNGAEVYISWTDVDSKISEGGEKYSKPDGTEITYDPTFYKETGNVKSLNITKSIRIDHKEETQYLTLNKNNEFEYTIYSNDYRATDLIVLDILIGEWKRKIPNYDLALCSPNNESCSIIPYKSPLKPFVPDPEPESLPKIAVNETPKEPITIILPESIKVKIDTTFKIFIGKNKEVIDQNKVLQDDEITDLSDEYTEEGFAGSEETPFDLMQDSEILRDDNPSSPPPPDGGGSITGGSQVNSPGGSVSRTEVSLPTDLSKVRNSSVIKTQSMGGSSRGINNDIKSPKGDVVLGSDITKSMNEFVLDVLGPFATFLKTKYPSLYSSWQITSATRGYVPPGGSLTSQHMKGEAIDSQIAGANANNPGKNIELLNAMLEWYKTNKVGYGQILFETRGNSCWIHWSYKRGNTKLSLLRFAQDKTLRSASINTTGRYVLPPVNASQLGFSNYA
jgi:hypothetical protein